MSWICPKCDHFKFKVTSTGSIICIQCGNEVNASQKNELVTVSPGPTSRLQLESESDESDLEKQSSFDKKSKKLKGIALKNKIKQIKKQRESFGDEEELIDTEHLKSSLTGVYIENTKNRSKKPVKLKETIRLKSLALQRECGYAVRVNILGPKPEFGVRGVGLTLNLADKNGDYAPTGCSKFHVKNVSQEKSTVNRGTMFLKGVQGNYEKKLTPTRKRMTNERRTCGVDMISPTGVVSLLGDTSEPKDLSPEEFRTKTTLYVPQTPTSPLDVGSGEALSEALSNHSTSPIQSESQGISQPSHSRDISKPSHTQTISKPSHSQIKPSKPMFSHAISKPANTLKARDNLANSKTVGVKSPETSRLNTKPTKAPTVRKVSTDKAIPKQTKPQAISPPVSLHSTALPVSSKPANASSEEAKPVSSKPAFGRVPAGLTITATGKICCIELTI